MTRANPDLSMTCKLAGTCELTGLDVARQRSRRDDRLPPGTCALVIGGLSVGMWALACLGLHVLG